jgi:hypothetical protein
MEENTTATAKVVTDFFAAHGKEKPMTGLARDASSTLVATGAVLGGPATDALHIRIRA